MESDHEHVPALGPAARDRFAAGDRRGAGPAVQRAEEEPEGLLAATVLDARATARGDRPTCEPVRAPEAPGRGSGRPPGPEQQSAPASRGRPSPAPASADPDAATDAAALLGRRGARGAGGTGRDPARAERRPHCAHEAVQLVQPGPEPARTDEGCARESAVALVSDCRTGGLRRRAFRNRSEQTSRHHSSTTRFCRCSRTDRDRNSAGGRELRRYQ